MDLVKIAEYAVLAVGIASCLAKAAELIVRRTETKKDDAIVGKIVRGLEVIKGALDRVALNPKAPSK